MEEFELWDLPAYNEDDAGISVMDPDSSVKQQFPMEWFTDKTQPIKKFREFTSLHSASAHLPLDTPTPAPGLITFPCPQRNTPPLAVSYCTASKTYREFSISLASSVCVQTNAPRARWGSPQIPFDITGRTGDELSGDAT